MSSDPVNSLPLAQRLALSYVRGEARAATLALLLLDTRLADAVRRAGEPVLAQIKLAWWRDRFAEPAEIWPEGEPLLDRLHAWPGTLSSLGSLVDGWEALLAETLNESDLAAFARGRAEAWTALGEGLGVRDLASTCASAREWALADICLHLGNATEVALARSMLEDGNQSIRLPAQLRSLAVLRALTIRAVKRDSSDPLDGAGAMLVALRSGLTGR